MEVVNCCCCKDRARSGNSVMWKLEAEGSWLKQIVICDFWCCDGLQFEGVFDFDDRLLLF